MINFRKSMFLGTVLIFLAFALPVIAEKKDKKVGHQDKHQSSDHGKSKQMKHQGGGQKMHLFTEDWHDTLTHDQKIKVDRMHIQLMKETAPIKAEIKRKKIELAVLATDDRPDTKEIHRKIDEILGLKRQKMQKRFDHIVEMRQILSPEQRLSYDMLIVSRAAQPKR